MSTKILFVLSASCVKLLFLIVYEVCVHKIATNGLGLGVVGELEAEMLNKPQMLIEVQVLNLAFLPPLRQTLVS